MKHILETDTDTFLVSSRKGHQKFFDFVTTLWLDSPYLKNANEIRVRTTNSIEVPKSVVRLKDTGKKLVPETQP